MGNEPRSEPALDVALNPFPAGELVHIAHGSLVVDIAPLAGGRVAQIARDGEPWLVGQDDGYAAMIAWGSYPMLPWVGRIRRGRFDFDEHSYQLPLNLGGHAIHGVGFSMPWSVDAHSSTHVDLSLALPEDRRWPFGGVARQRIEVAKNRLRMDLSVKAGALAMPAAIGWHPWFRKPDSIDFNPEKVYSRDAEGIVVHPLLAPPLGPWDDCFVNYQPVLIHRGQQTLRLTSDCRKWVVYDEPAHATCIEPQTGPPDSFNLEPMRLAPGASLAAWFMLEWL